MQSRCRIRHAGLLLLIGALLSACGEREEKRAEAPASPAAMWVLGAGSTFAAPLMKKWIEVFEGQNPAIRVSYDVVGSGEGVNRFITGSIDFGATDAPLTERQVAQVTRGAIQVPVTAGMIAIAYNVAGVGSGLRLPQDVYVDIFAGKIAKWNDPRIGAANPSLQLPNKNIVVVARQDSSGTTFAFTNHLSAVSAKWRDAGLSVGKLIDWSGGAMLAKGNEGVAQRIKISDGAIGYVEYGFANRLGLPMAALQNSRGEFIFPASQSGQKALLAGVAQDPTNLQITIPNPEGEGAYPIVTFTWMLVNDTYPDEKKAGAVRKFAGWSLNEGQLFSARLGYTPLPPDLVSKADALVQRIH